MNSSSEKSKIECLISNFSRLNISYEDKIEYIVNLTIGEYFISNSILDREDKMRTLFKKLTNENSLIKQSIGKSRWEKTDIIKLVPNDNANLVIYVKENYSDVWPYVD